MLNGEEETTVVEKMLEKRSRINKNRMKNGLCREKGNGICKGEIYLSFISLSSHPTYCICFQFYNINILMN